MTPEHDILQVTPRVEALAALCRSNSRIDPALYRKYGVKRGLRNDNVVCATSMDRAYWPV